MHDRNHRKLRMTFTVIVCTCVFWVAVVLLYQGHTSQDIKKQIVSSLEERAALQCANFQNNLNREFQILDSIANQFSITGLSEQAQAEDILRSFSGPDFSRMWILGADGTCYASDGDTADTAQSGALARVFAGERVLDWPATDAGATAAYITMAAPVLQGDTVIAALGCSMKSGRLSGDLFLGGNPDGGRRLIIDQNGIAIPADFPDDAWWEEREIPVGNGLSVRGALLAQERQNIGSDGNTYLIGTKSKRFYVTLQPLVVNGWTLLYATDEESARQEYAFIGDNLLTLNLVISAGFIVMVVWLINIRGRERQAVQQEKDRLAWIEERYRILAKESDDVIFEISLTEKLIEANENFHKLLGYNVIQWNSEYMRRVHPDDEQKFLAIYEGIKAGKRLMKEDLRFRRADGTYIWCHLLIAVLFDSKGKPTRVLGKITNIDMQKRESAWLRQKAQQDSLTNLYNKETTHNMICRFLETEGVEGVHGLMVLDVDDFKMINDTRGHLYGDAVLSTVSDKLRMLFRSTDIVGRIGGDEFLVFLKNVNSRAQMETQAAALLSTFANAPDYKITCSIGAAVYPEDGAGIGELFQNADTALYLAKKNGKNRYMMYRRETVDRTNEPNAGESRLGA